MDVARAVLTRNLEMEGLDPAGERFQARLRKPHMTIEDGMLFVSFASETVLSSIEGTGKVNTFTYRRERRPDELKQLPYLTVEACERQMLTYRALLGFPEGLAVVSRLDHDEIVEFRLKEPPRLSHVVDSSWSLAIDRCGGVLLRASGGRAYDYSSLLAPKVSSTNAARIGLSEYQRAGMFTITQISDPILMAGRPMTTDEYRDRVSLDRLNQFKGDKPVAFWRVGFQESDGAKFAGTLHIVDIDTQTGEIVGQARMSQLGGGSEPPVITWSKIGKVGVVGDRSKATGTIEAVTTQGLPGGKPVAVQAGKLIYACRYDVKKNILWRRLPDGKYEPGRPAASLVKALKAQAK